MKKAVSILLLLLLTAALLLPVSVSADVVTPEDYLTFTLVDGTYTVTDCVESFAGDMVIPAEKDGIPVTAIGNAAFFGCHTLSSVTIPDSVTTIGNQAFQFCTHLSNVVIPDSVTTIGFDVLNDTAYYNNEKNWKNGVLYVGDRAVAGTLQDAPDETPPQSPKRISPWLWVSIASGVVAVVIAVLMLVNRKSEKEQQPAEPHADTKPKDENK